MIQLIHAMKSVVLTSEHAEKTAMFYRDVLDLPLEAEEHPGTARHWACQLRDLHFAVHERATFWLETAPVTGPPGTIVSFEVADLDALLQRLRAENVEVISRREIGPMKFIALRDPDGRYVCCGTPWPV